MATGSLKRRRDFVLGSGAELFYDVPVELVRGEGVYLYDRDGRRFVDMYNNVPCVGHANTDYFNTFSSSPLHAAVGNVLEIRPPLVFSHKNADEFLGAFDECMGEMGG